MAYDRGLSPGVKRWIPAATMLLVSLISYIDRNTLALLAPTILRETKLNGEEYGWVISAFSLMYMAGNPLWGKLLDHFGLRWGMMGAVSVWSVASAAHALARGFWGFAFARAALGFGEGATFPGGLRAVVQTLPPSQRSRGIAVAYSGGSLGAVVTPLIITPVAVWWGWRAAFLFTGLMGACWLAVWAVVSRRPEIRTKHVSQTQPAPFCFSDRRVWGFMALYALGALPLAFVLYGAAIYLGQALGKSQASIGKVLWIPPLGWEAGYFFWGTVVDKLTALGRFHRRNQVRLLAVLAAGSLGLATAGRSSSYVWLLVQFFFSMFLAAGFIILSVAYATHAFTPSHAGLIAGLGAGAWSAAVALVMPIFGRLFDLRLWEAAFALAASFPAVGWLLWWWASRGRSEASS